MNNFKFASIFTEQNAKTPLYLRVKAIPSSAKNEVLEILEMEEGPTYKIRIKAPPQKGKANQELIKFLAKELEISKQNISIISGHTEQIKLIRIN